METSSTSNLARPEPATAAARRGAGDTVAALTAGALLAGAAVAALSGTDEQRVRLGPLSTSSTCPYRRLTGHKCPGCGMTRAVALALRGKPWRATRTHPAAIPLLAMLAHRLGEAVRSRRAPAVAA